MDINNLTESIRALTAVISILKPLLDLLPKGPKKEVAVTALEQAEHQLILAEAQTMQNFCYEICRNHEMPVIMLSKDDVNWECPKCKNQKYTGMTAVPNPFDN